MYIYVYTDNSNNIITCIQDTQHTINRELYLSFDLRRPSTPEQGYDSIGAMASQDSHGPQSISTWSRPRYQTSATLQPFKPQQLQPTVSHSPHACPTPGVYTFTVTQSIGCYTSLSLGFNNRPAQEVSEHRGSRSSNCPQRFPINIFPELLFVVNILTLINIISSASPTCSYHEKT
jgi:hypothetical protein